MWEIPFHPYRKLRRSLYLKHGAVRLYSPPYLHEAMPDSLDDSYPLLHSKASAVVFTSQSMIVFI